ncbi:MAG: efflux RND transporter permease subunit [Anaerolineae bacterium]
MLMIILGLVVLGYRSLTELPVDRYPSVDFPYVSVVTVFPGAGPEDIEDLVIKPIEDAVAGIPGIDQLVSISQEGVGFVVVAFKEGVDGDQAAIEVERQVATVRGSLPDEALDPSIIKADINAIPIMEIILSGPQGQDALSEVARDEIKPRLQTIQGVAAVNISGGREQQIQIEADPAQLAAYGLPLESIQQALALNNLTFPTGSIDEGRQKTSIRSVGEFTSLEEIENVVVAGGPSPFGSGSTRSMPGQDNGGLVFLRDVASVREGFEDQSQVLRYNGEDAVNISVIKTSDANTIEMADSVRQVIEELRQELPPGAELTIVADDSEFTRESVAAVQEDLILAVLVTGLVMLVFLHTIRSTFIVLLAIPTSLISTFLVMWALGFSLNVLTLLALTLTIGILVDDSVVVLENIERHLKMKKKPKQAALDGRSQIGLAAITISLVDVAIYVPVAFTSGIVGQFFRSYGITIATAVLFSLFVSFTLTPMLAAQWMRDESQLRPRPRGLRKFFGLLLWPIDRAWKGFVALWEWGFGLLTRAYAATIRLVLKNFLTQSLTVLVAAAAVALGIFMVVSGVVGTEFFPQEDDAKFTVNIEMPAGTNLQATDQAARQAERIILDQVPETVSILTRVGSSGGAASFFGGGGTANAARILVQVVDKNERERSTTDIIEALRPELKKIPEANISLVLSSIFSGGMGSAVEIQVYGEDPKVLIDLANQVEAVMRTVPGTTDILNTDAAQAPEARLVIDRDRALDQGLSPAQVAGTLRTALSGADVGKFKRAGTTDIDIVLRMNQQARSNLDQLLDMPLGYRNGRPVKLGQVASVERDLAPAVINRTDRQRTLSVSAGVTGRASGDVTDDVEAAIRANVEFPAGYGFRLSGQSEAQRESFADLTTALGLGILLVYMLLVALFQSWLHPLAIMFSLPVALLGAFGGLWLTGHTLNLLSMLGIILLAGIVTKNAILLVDFTNELRRKEGYTRKEALAEAGRLRLRPILMTTAAIVFALLPILLGRGAGAETRAPLAAVIIGGNITSTALTLILVPVVYNFFDGGSNLATRWLRRLFGSEPTPEEGEKGKTPAPRPAPQPGPAASLSSSAAQPDPDVA